MDARAEAQARDPASHQFHLAAGTLALCLAPLGIVLGEVALGLFLAVSLARARALWPVWIQALRSPLAVAIMLFVAWMLLSLLWSTDPHNGLDRVQCMRALVWGPLLYPLLGDMRSRVQLLCALLLGTAILGGSQVVDWIMFVSAHGDTDLIMPRFGGFHGEVGKAGLWSGAGVCIGAFLSLDDRLSARVRLAATLAAAICVTGLFASSTLRALTGVAVGMVAVALFNLARPPAGRVQRLLMLCPLVTVALIGLAVATYHREARDRRVGDERGREVAAATGPSHEVMTIIPPGDGMLERILTMPSVAPRLFWWRACWEGFLSRPACGWGWGSTPTILKTDSRSAEFAAQNLRVITLHPGMFEASQPHSLYVMTIAELGAVGGALLAAIVCILLRGAVRAARSSVALCGPAAATVLWLVVAAGDTVFNTSVLAAGAIVIAVGTTLPRRDFMIGPQKSTGPCNPTDTPTSR